MLFPSPSTWKMMKDAPNHVPMNMIGFDQTSREILEDGDVPVFLVVLIHWFQSYYLIQSISIWRFKRTEFHSILHIPFSYLESYVIPFTFHLEDDERRP